MIVDEFEVYFELLLSVVLAKTPFIEGAGAGLPASSISRGRKKKKFSQEAYKIVEEAEDTREGTYAIIYF
jgi:hypothetical protein